jgi:iron complex transport system ATP-binding protein
METILELKEVSFSYNSVTVLNKINLSVIKGEILGILGPNGAGKSTLLRLIDRILKPQQGEIFLKQRPLSSYKRIELAKEIAMVGQEDHFRFPYSVIEVVLMGRFPYSGRLQFENKMDLQIACSALEMTNSLHLAKKSIYEISGGERQRVLIARAIAQQPSIILLDEVTSFLDIKFKKEILELLQSLKQQGITLIIASHDIELMARYCDRIALLKNGIIYSLGIPHEVINETTIKTVYECPVIVSKDPVTSAPKVTIK